MGLTIKNLGAGTLAQTTSETVMASGIVTTGAMKSVLIKNIMLINRNTGSARTVNIYLYTGGGDNPGTAHKISVAPINLSIPAKGQFVLDADIGLLGANVAGVFTADVVKGTCVETGSEVDFIVNGLERDA